MEGGVWVERAIAFSRDLVAFPVSHGCAPGSSLIHINPVLNWIVPSSNNHNRCYYYWGRG